MHPIMGQSVLITPFNLFGVLVILGSDVWGLVYRRETSLFSRLLSPVTISFFAAPFSNLFKAARPSFSELTEARVYSGCQMVPSFSTLLSPSICVCICICARICCCIYIWSKSACLTGCQMIVSFSMLVSPTYTNFMRDVLNMILMFEFISFTF